MIGSPMADGTQPQAGVGVLIVDELGRVLLTLRKLPPEADCWSILGGKLDFLEALEECAIREAHEEAGVEIVIERLLCVTDHRLPSEGQHCVSPAFLARIVSGEPQKLRARQNATDRMVPSRPIAPKSDHDRAQCPPGVLPPIGNTQLLRYAEISCQPPWATGSLNLVDNRAAACLP
jgi:ADP-ribose pyrophosphatase YjhB (NUDIX family)